jgi:hypothetical protein
MTIEVEVKDEKGVNLLKQLEELNILKLNFSPKEYLVNNSHILNKKDEAFGPEQQAELMALSGSLNMNSERLNEYRNFLHEIRNEWE